TVAEFKSQCEQVGELIAAFAEQQEQYSTDELLKIINRRIVPTVPVRIAGVSGPVTARAIAAYLFEIGFLTARRDSPDGSYEHVAYADVPSLLQARPNIDQGMSWEIHPVFRQALLLRDATGREVKRPK